MIALKRVLAPVDDTAFDEICSFETESYIGIWAEPDGFILMTKEDIEFQFSILGHINSLEKLDDLIYDKYKEHIESVSTSRCLSISIVEN